MHIQIPFCDIRHFHIKLEYFNNIINMGFSIDKINDWQPSTALLAV